MKVSLGGSVLEVLPDCELNAHELEALAHFATSGDLEATPDFCLEIVQTPPWTNDDRGLFATGKPARVRVAGSKILLSHRLFTADLDPWQRTGRLFRREGHSAALEITLRVAVSSLLPLGGGVPLHAAGVIARNKGLVFFGPSGAGKSTLAGCSPFPVLSDELVVVRGDPFVLKPSGFWGAGSALTRDSKVEAPLWALIKLDRGPEFELVPMAPAEAWRQLTEVVIIPAQPRLWRLAVEVVTRLIASVPVFRMRWSPSSPPWDDLLEALREQDDSAHPVESLRPPGRTPG